ncbi:hypothetical protein BT63DRAFT_128985 [Microthyrium microscopicum]|uniref:Uncharacterized protein n=1 Tax=Microthyrium microscopicum TaxID=703497 RepID=A0A6A6TSZ9_9PEZI|nr:hypothetical protein BT63DRAFT_128985 [Microthyrium microscopicum]
MLSSKKWIQYISLELRAFWSCLNLRYPVFILWVITLPHYRLYHFNTIEPILCIARLSSEPDCVDLLHYQITQWRSRKEVELQYTSIASAILAGAVIGSLSWTWVPDSYWLSSALWYCAIVVSIFGVLTSAQLLSILHILGPLDAPGLTEKSRIELVNDRYLPLLVTKPIEHGNRHYSGRKGGRNARWKMVFTWQFATMCLSYGVCLYLGGLTIVVCSPLIHQKSWSGESNIAIVYLGFGFLATASFIYSSFYIYHYVELDYDEKQWTNRRIMADISPSDTRRPLETEFSTYGDRPSGSASVKP